MEERQTICAVTAVEWLDIEMQKVVKRYILTFIFLSVSSMKCQRVIALISAEMRPFVVVHVYPGNHCSNHVFRSTLTLY